MVFAGGLLQDRMSRGAKHIRCQAANSRLSSFRARCWLCLSLQMQPRLLCVREPQKEDTTVSWAEMLAVQSTEKH